MTEQLYKIERGRVDCLNCNVVVPATYIGEGKVCDILVPVPAPHTLAWAMGEMLSHEKQAYSGCEHVWRRYAYGSFDSSMDKGKTWQSGGEAQIFWSEERTSTSWSPCDELPRWTPEPQPEFPHAEEGVEDEPAIVHGTREWLASLPDGTRVRHIKYHAGGSATKRGERLFANNWGDPDGVPISECGDSGWSLAPEEPTQPQAEPTLEQRVERLEKLMEVKS